MVSLALACFVIAGAIWLWVLISTLRTPEQRVAIRRATIGVLVLVPLLAAAGWWWTVR